MLATIDLEKSNPPFTVTDSLCLDIYSAPLSAFLIIALSSISFTSRCRGITLAHFPDTDARMIPSFASG